MKKSARYLLALCIAAVAGVLVLQVYWINNYYQVNKATFEKEVNLTLEDAVKKEFAVRCDSIQQHLFNVLIDTTQYLLSNKYNAKRKTTLFRIINTQKPSDASYFHTDSLSIRKGESDAGFRVKMASYFAREIRVSELESHFIFYHTQKLGDYVLNQTFKYDFDTARLRPIFKRLLAERDIHVPFTFYLRTKDSTFNKSHFNPAIATAYPVISKAFITYKKSKSDHYIRAMFSNPFPYIAGRMGFLFGGSILLILVVAFSLFYLLRSLYREKKLSAIKNDFISNITHEFKTPIATVAAAVEALDSFGVLEDKEKTHRYLTHSKNELDRLSELVDKVLNISFYENQQFDIKPEPLNIDEIISAILNKSVAVSTKPVHYIYNNNSAIKIVPADRLHFQHAISNVVDNAIKYGGEQVDIIVTCTARQNYTVIAVKDNGRGVSADNLPFVFEKFYRVPADHHQVKGHGLGLSYVKSIIEKHKGWCKMESEYGKGSILYLAWPI